LGRLSLQIGVSAGRARTATKLLHICPNKITVVPEIKPIGYEKRVRFCNWFTNHVRDRLLDAKLTFCTHEANFTPSGYVNSQNNRYWSFIPMECILLRDVYVRNSSTNIPAISVFIGVAIVIASQHVLASRGHHQVSTISTDPLK
jgi:hypothetical protein